MTTQNQDNRPGVVIDIETTETPATPATPATPSTPAPSASGTVIITAGSPGKLEKLAMPEGSTVRDVLQKANLNPEGFEVRLGGVKCDDLNQVVRDGQSLLLLRPVRGNGDNDITVTAGLPGQLKKFNLAAGSTVRDVLRQAELNPEGYHVRIGGDTITNLDQPLVNGQAILLLRPVRGN